MNGNWNCELKKTHRIFCHVVYKTRSIVLKFGFWLYLPQSIINVFHLTEILRLQKLKIRVFVKILMLEKRNSKKFLLSYDNCCQVYWNEHFTFSDHRLAKNYFNMLAELYKYGFQCSASSPSGLNWSTTSSTRPSISRGQGRGRAFATKDSTLNSCLIASLLFLAKF